MKAKKIAMFLAVMVVATAYTPAAGQMADEKRALIRVSDTIKFENALQFYRLRNYSRALLEFREYLEVYINGEHRNEAYRYIAGIYFDMFEYDKSIMAYTALYQESINSEEGIEAYYKSGICYQKMGNDTKAREIFEAIMRQYPYSNFAHLSKIQMDLLMIIGK